MSSKCKETNTEYFFNKTHQQKLTSSACSSESSVTKKLKWVHEYV